MKGSGRTTAISGGTRRLGGVCRHLSQSRDVGGGLRVGLRARFRSFSRSFWGGRFAAEPLLLCASSDRLWAPGPEHSRGRTHAPTPSAHGRPFGGAEIHLLRKCWKILTVKINRTEHNPTMA
jgi:hypothetical protein